MTKQTYTKKELLHWYEEMLLIRKFEEKAAQLYTQRKIRGFCHLYIGQEAVAVGIETAIRNDDYVITAYRDHGNALARGMSADECMAELYGKKTGCSKGNGGSMHFFSKEHNFLGGHGIVGGQIPLGAGIAFAIKYREEDKVCVCLMGDGAVRQGAFHEAFNMAMTWQLPVLFICENNNYAMGTSVERTSNVTDLFKLGSAYDMPSAPMNGMDVIDVHETVKACVDKIRAGGGPMFLEAKTYRYRGHSMSDPAKYRTREELNRYKDLDPIINLKLYMKDHEVEAEDEITDMRARIKKIVDASVKFAEESPFPDPNDLYGYVYTDAYPYIMD